MPAEAMAVAFLGPEGTFTSEAATVVLRGDAATRMPLATIPEVVAAVLDGRAALGVVPIENSIEGSVSLTLDALAFGPIGAYIRAEVALPISMCLVAPAGLAREGIRVVRSQPHALAQCRQWLAAHLPGVPQEACTSTAEAARRAASGDGSAALGTRAAADRFGLAVIAADVHDHPGNTTRFVVLGPRMHPPTGADKTSVVVFFGEDRPGLLLRTLEEFALRGINLTKIESRPTKKSLGEYAIFIDCDGHLSESRVAEALRGVHRHVAELRVLGSYPRADGIAPLPAPFDSDAAYADAAAWHAGLLGDIG